jgi:hypothetical protein
VSFTFLRLLLFTGHAKEPILPDRFSPLNYIRVDGYLHVPLGGVLGGCNHLKMKFNLHYYPQT